MLVYNIMPRRGSYDKFTYWTGPIATPEMKKLAKSINEKVMRDQIAVQTGGCRCQKGGMIKTINGIRSKANNKQMNILRAEHADRNYIRKLANEFKSYEINRRS